MPGNEAATALKSARQSRPVVGSGAVRLFRAATSNSKSVGS